MEMNEALFDNIINTAQDCVFWKDRDRRFVGVNQAFLDYYGFENRLISVMSILQNGLGITDMYYVGKGGRLHSPIDVSMSYDAADIGDLVEDELWAGRGITEIKDRCPKLYEALEKLKVGSAIIAKIGLNSQTDGYLILAGGREDRIWQEDECGMVYFIAKSLAAYLRLGDERIPD